MVAPAGKRMGAQELESVPENGEVKLDPRGTSAATTNGSTQSESSCLVFGSQGGKNRAALSRCTFFFLHPAFV